MKTSIVRTLAAYTAIFLIAIYPARAFIPEVEPGSDCTIEHCAPEENAESEPGASTENPTPPDATKPVTVESSDLDNVSQNSEGETVPMSNASSIAETEPPAAPPEENEPTYRVLGLRHEFWTIIFSLLLTVSSIGLWRQASGQARIMRETLDFQRQSLALINEGHLIIARIEAVDIEGNEPKIIVRIQNVGKTRVTMLDERFFADIAPLPRIENAPQLPDNFVRREILEGLGFSGQFKIPQIPPENIQRLRDRSEFLWFAAALRYVTVFDEEYEFRFSAKLVNYRVDPNGEVKAEFSTFEIPEWDGLRKVHGIGSGQGR